MRTTKEIGDFYENLACDHYRELGHRIIQRNYRFKKSEIDIITSYDNFIFFVEVKFRTSINFGLPEEMVTTAQEERILLAAENYILDNNIMSPIRFDIAVFNKLNEIQIFPDAFG